MVFSFFDWVYKERTDDLKHSMDLYRELKIRANSEIIFNSDKKDLRLYIKSKTDEPPDKFNDLIDYSEEVNSHLEDSAYKNIRDIIERRCFYINSLHNNELREFLDKLNSEITSELQKTFKINKWDEVSQPVPAKYYTKNLPLDIGMQVLSRYGKKQSLSLNSGTESNNNVITKYKIFVDGSLLVVTDNDKEILEISTMIRNMDCALKVDNKLSYGSL